MNRLRELPTPALVSASQRVFNDVPVRNPGTLAFVPIVDGELLPDYPVKVAREGRSHQVPLIIGTNKDEAALFRLMRSPLMPITPRAITSMFTEIAAEQPDLQLPTEEQLGSAYSRVRGKARGLSIASDVGFRMPSVLVGSPRVTARWHRCILYRFDWSTPMLKLLLVGAAHAMELPYVWGTLGAPKKSPHAETRWCETRQGGLQANQGQVGQLRDPSQARGLTGRTGLDALPGDDRACLLIDRHDKIVYDIDKHIRAAWGSDAIHFR